MLRPKNFLSKSLTTCCVNVERIIWGRGRSLYGTCVCADDICETEAFRG